MLYIARTAAPPSARCRYHLPAMQPVLCTGRCSTVSYEGQCCCCGSYGCADGRRHVLCRLSCCSSSRTAWTCACTASMSRSTARTAPRPTSAGPPLSPTTLAKRPCRLSPVDLTPSNTQPCFLVAAFQALPWSVDAALQLRAAAVCSYSAHIPLHVFRVNKLTTALWACRAAGGCTCRTWTA